MRALRTPPLVTTAPVTEITSVSALGGGNVINDGGSDVYLRGLVWNTEGMPTVENYTGNTVVSGGLGEFESQISGLDQGTLYYVRAFAVNDFGPGYGSQVSFETSTDDNTYLLTIDISPINGGEAAGAGEYAAGSEVNVVGSPNEGYQFVNWEGDNDHVEDIFSLNTVLIMPAGNTNLIAVFDEEEEDDNGGGNGEPGDGVTDIDDNFYPSVIIGDQEWMAANLRVTRYKNGVSIPTELDDTQWALTTSGAYAVYPHTDVDGLDSAADVVDAYGKLYNWYAVSDPGGLCPTGWRVPTHDDWTELEQFVCEQLGNEDCVVKFPFNASTMGWRGTNEGMALKSCRQLDHPYDEECNTTEHPRWGNFYMYNGFDEFGFSGLPGGSRQGDGSFHNISGFVGYWSSTEGPNASHAWYRALNLFFGNVNRFSNDMGIGHSVRCIREN